MDPDKLLQQAKDAIAQGADSATVMKRYHSLMAQDAISHGADPEAVNKRLAELTGEAPQTPGPTLSHTRPDPTSLMLRIAESPAANALAATGATIASGLPGGRAAMSGIGALTSGESFSKARGQLDESTGKIQGPLSVLEKGIGGVASLAIPGLSANPTLLGAELGGANAALSADDESLKRRAFNTTVGAGAGGALGKLTDIIGTGIRTARAPNASQNVLNQEAALGTIKSQRGALADALDAAPSPNVVKISDDIPAGFAPNRHATEEQLAYRAARLGGGAPPVAAGPSPVNAEAQGLLRDADQAIAGREAGVNATRRGMDAALGGADRVVSGSQAGTMSRAAILNDISKMSEAERAKFVEGLAGNVDLPLSVNPLKLFGIPKSAGTLSRVGGLIRAAEPQGGMLTRSTLAALLAGLAPQ